MKDDYPSWVCSTCGEKFGNKSAGVATWHYDTCGVCGRYTKVTEPRDYGHLKDGWRYEDDVEEDPYDVTVSDNLNI